jgi:hypothetical protein
MKLDEVPFVGVSFSFFPGWGCFRKGGLMVDFRVWRRRRRRRRVHPTALGFGVSLDEVG